jgi:hypothetical protein
VWAECEDFIYKNSVHISQETHNVRYKAQLVDAVGETIAVNCENHTEHINTLCRQNARFCMLKQLVYRIKSVK